MGGDGSCPIRSCTSGEVTRRVGPEEDTNLGDRSLDSRCAAGGAMATVVCVRPRTVPHLPVLLDWLQSS